MQVSDLLEHVKAAVDAPSDNKLSRMIHTTPAQISMWRRGVYFPKDQKLIELCELAGIPEDVGLMWLNVWRSDEKAKPIYEKLARDLEKRASKTNRAA